MLDSDVKIQQQQKTNKNNKKKQLSKHNKAKSSHSPGPTAFQSPGSEIASLNIGCLGPRFGPDFGLVPVHGYHFGAALSIALRFRPAYRFRPDS